MNIPHPPAVTWRTHLSLALLALVYIFSVIDRQIIAILMEPIKREFGASDTQMGLLSGLAFGLFYAALGVPVGKLADKYNRRMIVAVCCSLWSLATLACGFAGQFWQLLLARMSVAIGEAGATNAGLLAAAILATNSPELTDRIKAYRTAQSEGVAERPS